MPKSLSAKDQRIKEMMEKTLADPDLTWFGRYRGFFNLLPSDPRRVEQKAIANEPAILQPM